MVIDAVARVLDSNNPNRTGVTNSIQYIADNEAPSIQISEPNKELLSLADDLDGDLVELKARGLELIDETPRNGASGHRVAFLSPSSTNGVLIELVERPA